MSEEEETRRTDPAEAPDAPESAASRDEAGVPAETPPSEVQELRLELEQKEQDLREANDRALRALAEADNVRKRAQREKTDGIRFANEALLREVLPVLDNLELALAHSSGEGSLVEGVQMVLKLFRDLLERHGVTEVGAEPGETFDPSVHEALATEATNQYPANAVLRREMRGYRLHDRLLRPARVVVAAAGETSTREPGK